MFAPLTFSVLFAYTVHPEIPLTFFFYASLLYVVKSLNSKGTRRKFNLVIFGMGVALLLLTRQIGVLLGYILLSLISLLLPFSIKFRKTLLAILIISVIMYLSSSSIQILILQLVFITAILITIKRMQVSNLQTIKRMKEFLLLLIPLIPLTVFFSIVALQAGLLFYTLPGGDKRNREYIEFGKLFSEIESYPSIYALLRFDDIFLLYFFLSFTFPCFVGVFYCIANRNDSKKTILSLLLILSIATFILRYSDYYPSLCPPNYSYTRRLFVFLPLISVLSSAGITVLIERGKQNMLMPQFAYFLISSAYVLQRMLNLKSITLDKLYRLLIAVSEYASPLDVLVMILILLASFGVVYIIDMIKKNVSIREVPYIEILICLLIGLGAITSILSSFEVPFQDSVNNWGDLRMESRFHRDLIHYFQATDANGYIIGARIYHLATFTNAKVIDLSTFGGYMTFRKLFGSQKDTQEIVEAMKKLNITYVVIPKDQHSFEYRVFQTYMNKFPSFQKILHDRSKLEKSFEKEELYFLNL